MNTHAPFRTSTRKEVKLRKKKIILCFLFFMVGSICVCACYAFCIFNSLLIFSLLTSKRDSRLVDRTVVSLPPQHGIHINVLLCTITA